MTAISNRMFFKPNCTTMLVFKPLLVVLAFACCGIGVHPCSSSAERREVPDRPQLPPAEPEPDALHGMWKAISFEASGAAPGWFPEPETIHFGQATTFGSVAVPPRIMIEARVGLVLTIDFNLAKAGIRNTIDFIPIALWGGKGKDTYRGIYRLDGDKLHICVNNSAKDARPTDFELKKGANRFVVVLEREPKEEKKEKQPMPPKQRKEFSALNAAK